MTTMTQSSEVVTLRVGRQWFGVPVLDVQEVISSSRVARVPLAPPEVAGFINLRGHIVTAIDLRTLLKIPGASADHQMNVVVHDADELFALLVDEAGDVVNVIEGTMDPLPSALDPVWARSCVGVVRMEHGLLVVLDIEQLLKDSHNRL